LVQSRWRSWVWNFILVYLNFLSHPPDGIKSDLFRFIMEVLLIIKFPSIYFM
jgi:hypothetical protein